MMMGLLEKYRSSSDYREILRILQKSTSLRDNFLWQSHVGGKNIIPIHQIEIDFVSRDLVAIFDSKQFKLDAHLPIYVKLDYRSSVFKVTEFREIFNSLHFSFPKEMKTMELRDTTRYHFSADFEKTISLRPTLSGVREAGDDLEVRIMDISRQGMGLMVSEKNRIFLKNNRILWITKLGGRDLDYPLLAEVLYISNGFEEKTLHRTHQVMKVGVKFSEILSQDFFDLFIG